MAVIATAGHVDHGKSSLVRALTGIDPDRLAEEKRRGMSIELGFAHATGPRGTLLSFIDVPGHADLVRTMIAGASGVDLVLLVIDAREGWKPQTDEHLAVCELLGVSTGLVALTKVDLVSSEKVEELTARTRTRLAASDIAWSGVMATSTRSGAGIEELTAALESAVSTAHRHRTDLDRPRLFIDRVFTMVGAGTVVTGTLDSGNLATGATLMTVPGNHRAVVRAVQVHGSPVQSAQPGQRCAVNLAHTSQDDVARGRALVVEGQWHLTGAVDAHLRCIEGKERLLVTGRGYTVHWGTNRQACAIRMIPGAGSSARLRFAQPLPLTPGDRFILRHTGTDTTIAGGIVVDVAPRRRVSRARPDGTIDLQLEAHGWVNVEEARRLTGRRIAPVAGDWFASPSLVESTTKSLEERLARAPLDLVALAPHERALLSTLPDAVIEHGTARRSTVASIVDHPLATDIRRSGLTPSQVDDADRDVVRRLVRAGTVFEHDGRAFHIDTLVSLLPALRELWADNEAGFTVSQLRVRLGITRKHAVPLAECLDKAGITRRRGDLRQRGPRASPGNPVS